MSIEAPTHPTQPAGHETPQRLTFGDGEAVLDPVTGAPQQFIDHTQPTRRFLLASDLTWHSVEHQWGSGHITTDAGSSRWNAPASLTASPDSVVASFRLEPDLQLTVTRRPQGAELIERYEFTNTSSRPVTITSLGVQTPFADVYQNAENALEASVHAHIFTGGSWAWVAAQPMSGTGNSLGLIVEEGSLNGYSIESRNQNSLSNARGHIVLQVTDYARNPAAFGGQPQLALQPGETTTLQWRLGWYETLDAFLAATNAPATLENVAVPLDQPVRITSDRAVHADDPRLTITHAGEVTEVRSSAPGNFVISIGDARTEIAFNEHVDTVARRRSEYIIAHQRTAHRAGLLAHAFVPVDTVTKLTQSTNGWSDWSDGSERIGMALLLQMAVRRQLIDTSHDNLLAGWAAFAQAHLMDATGAPRRGSQDQHTGPRLYDAPWLAQFFFERYKHTGDTAHLDLAAKIMNRAFELGAEGFLAISFSETCVAVADAVAEAGNHAAAGHLRASLVSSARHFLGRGHRLPAHEVSYEQSIVAPLVNLFSDAYRLTGDPDFLDAVTTRIPWLLAFGGPQPHARLYGVGIRHWDGYWFGLRRQWGDVFPHYWSVLTAEALLRLPAELREDRFDDLARAILRANMSNFFEDGSATCAFIFPTAVDGAAAHHADPLANDQDWHLAIWLRLAEEGLVQLHA